METYFLALFSGDKCRSTQGQEDLHMRYDLKG